MERISKWSWILVLTALFGGEHAVRATPVLEGITYAVEPGAIYVPLEEAGEALHWRITIDDPKKVVALGKTILPLKSLRNLVDGVQLIKVGDLERAGAQVRRNPAGNVLNVGTAWRYFTVTVGSKRAEVNLAEQRLRGWQGDRLVLESRISSGRRGSTPTGNFRAGPYKARHHYSSRYDDAPMPWSVQVNGNIFIHGFTSVPKYPASHGCIRVPLNEGNPARFFYEWIDRGTPIRVVKK